MNYRDLREPISRPDWLETKVQKLTQLVLRLEQTIAS